MTVTAPLTAAPPVAPPTDEAGVVEDTLARLREQARLDLPTAQPAGRAAAVRTVLRDLAEGLRHLALPVAEHGITACDPILGGGLRIQAQPGAAARPVRVALDVSNADAGPGLFSVTSRLARQVQDGRAELALLVREQTASLPGGLSHQPFDAQAGVRGGVLWLDEADLVELLAIERLLHQAGAGLVRLDTRILTRADVTAQILSRPAGPPTALREIIGRLASLPEEAAPRPSPPGRPASGRVTQTLGTVPARDPGGAQRPGQLPGEGARGPGARQTLMMAPVAPPVTAQQILQVLRDRNSIPETELARDLGISVGTLSSMLAPLEAQGMVRFSTDASGHRVITRASQTAAHRVITPPRDR